MNQNKISGGNYNETNAASYLHEHLTAMKIRYLLNSIYQHFTGLNIHTAGAKQVNNLQTQVQMTTSNKLVLGFKCPTTAQGHNWGWPWITILELFRCPARANPIFSRCKLAVWLTVTAHWSVLRVQGLEPWPWNVLCTVKILKVVVQVGVQHLKHRAHIIIRSTEDTGQCPTFQRGSSNTF